MTNQEVITRFLNREKGATNKRQILNGYFYYEGRTLQTDGTNLINYTTKIAYFDNDNILHLNKTKYSATTSKIQNQLERLAIAQNEKIMEYMGE
ncbi:MAG: hypothetical protein ACI3T9_03860 [Romboutsia timonensis]